MIDADRMLVMNKGYCMQYDHPYRLLVDNDGDESITATSGIFADMVRSTGEVASKELFEIAKGKYH